MCGWVGGWMDGWVGGFGGRGGGDLKCQFMSTSEIDGRLMFHAFYLKIQCLTNSPNTPQYRGNLVGVGLRREPRYAGTCGIAMIA
jgi:hypothetical protein